MEDSSISRPFLTASGQIQSLLTFSRPVTAKITSRISTKIYFHLQTTNPSHWEAPKFSFTTEDQAAEWKKFNICALDYLETLDIDPEKQDENK